MITKPVRWRDAPPSASDARRSLEGVSDQPLEFPCLPSVSLHLFLGELRLKCQKLLDILCFGHFFGQGESPKSVFCFAMA